MSTDPWASAGAAPSAAIPSGSGFEGDLPAGPASSGLFGDDEFQRHPGLFNKYTPPETTVRGTLIEVRQVHATEFPRDPNYTGPRKRQYWEEDPQSGKVSKVTNQLNQWTRATNRPVLDQVVTIQTDLRDASVEDDEGVRTWFISGAKRLKDHAPGDKNTSSRGVFFAAASAAGIASDKDWAGKPIEVTRHHRQNPSIDTSLWLWSCKIG